MKRKEDKHQCAFGSSCHFFSLSRPPLSRPQRQWWMAGLQKGTAGHTWAHPVSIRAAPGEVCTARRAPLSSLNKCCFTEVVTVWFNYREKEKVHSSLWTAPEPEFTSLQGPPAQWHILPWFPHLFKREQSFLSCLKGREMTAVYKLIWWPKAWERGEKGRGGAMNT